MPFSGPGTYLETIDEFIGHWSAVNAELSPGAMTLPGGYTLANLQTGRDDLSTEMTELEDVVNAMEGLRTQRDNQEVPIHTDMKQIAAFVRGPLMDSDYVGEIPALPQFESDAHKWRTSMDDFASLWLRINTTPPAGFTPPMVLPNTTTQAQFQTKVTAHSTTLENYRLADGEYRRKIDRRDRFYLDIREQLEKYRATVEGMFEETDPLVTSIPRLVPLPGHTPDAVVLSGIWNGNKAELSWTESTDSDLDHYAVRRSPSNPYSVATESHVANVPIGTETLETLEGLEDPGSIMRYKVYVVLTTGNERGSNAVEIENPL
jgi:hypothetical protein